MSDHAATPPDGSHDAVRDALPALLHGRVRADERAALERHLAGCADCRAELALLAAVREAHTDAPAPVSVDRIAAAVRARTVAPAAPAVPASPPAPGRPARRHAPAWARRGALRAASVLLVVASGVLLSRGGIGGLGDTLETPSTAARVADGPTATAPVQLAAAESDASLLGVGLGDLSDTELAAVVAAVDDPASATPDPEPGSATPAALTPDGE